MDTFDSDSLLFMERTLRSSGQSEEACTSLALHFISHNIHGQESINEGGERK